MNKAEFIHALQRELKAGPAEAELALNAVLNTISRSVRHRARVKFRGFGTFSVKLRRARVVRHPGNGGRLFVPESRTMMFHPSAGLWNK